MKPTTVWGVIRGSLREQWARLTLLALVIAAATALESVPAFILMRVVDDQIAKGVYTGIWLLAALYLLALVAQRAVGFCQDYLTTIVGQGILHRLRLTLTSHLRALGLSYYDNTPVGEIMSRSTADVEAVNTLFTAGVVSMVADACKLLGVIGPMFALNARLTWVVLAVVPVIIAITDFFRRNIRGAQRRTRQTVGQINSTFEESLSGIKVIHTYGQEGAFAGLLAGHLRSYLVAANRASLFNSYFTPAMDILRGLLTAALVYVGVILAGGSTIGAVSAGTLVAFITQQVPRLFNPLTSLSDELQTIQEALAGTERINEVLQQPAEDRPAWLPLPDETPGRVVIEGLRFGYNRPRVILRDINLVVEPGQRVAIVGRTGAGKTSLLSVLAGVYAPWDGSITIDGIDPRWVRPAERRRLLGVVPQTIHLVSGTIR
ncbi:MAG: ABC transporter ATP-binding protein, partial [Chloroflexota bacterium]